MKYRNKLLEKRLNNFEESVIEVVKKLHSKNEEVKPALVFLVKHGNDFTVEALSISEIVDGPVEAPELKRALKKKAKEIEAISFAFVCEGKMIKTTGEFPSELDIMFAEKVVNISFELYNKEKILVLKKNPEMTIAHESNWVSKGTLDIPFANVIEDNYEPFYKAIQETIKFNVN